MPASLPAGGPLAGNGTGAFGLLSIGGIEYAYVPNGSYLEDPNAPWNPDISISPISGVTYTGISVVPLSSSGTKTQIDTPNPVNSCASNPNTGVLVCTSNENDIYVINAATNSITTTLQSAGNPAYPFYSSGGACVTCGVTVNPADNTAVIAVSTDPTTSPGMSGYQVLNLATNTLGSVFTVAGNHAAEAWSIDTDRNLLLSPTENVSFTQIDYCFDDGTCLDNFTPNGPWTLTQPAQFQLFDLSLATPVQYDYSQASTLLDPNSEMDTTVQDNTGVTLTTAEFTGDLLMTDMSQKTSGAGNPGSWNAPSQLQNLPELGPSYLYNPNWAYLGPAADYFTSGATAVSIATGSHYGFLEDEFGSAAIGAFILPATTTPGSATPVWDWVLAAMPNDPVTQAPWQNPFDPHGLAAAYATIGSGDAYGILMNTTYNATQNSSSAAANNGTSTIPYSRTSIAVVSLPKLLAAPRVSSCTQTVAPIATIIEAGSIVTVVTGTVDSSTGIVTPLAHGFSAGQTVTVGDLFNGWVVDDSGNLGYNGTFTITSVPDQFTFTYSASATGLGGLLTAGINPLFYGANATANSCTPDFSGHFVDPSYDLVANGVIRFFTVH